MKIQETSKDVIKGGILFLRLQTSYLEANTQKDEDTYIYAQENTLGAPEA